MIGWPAIAPMIKGIIYELFSIAIHDGEGQQTKNTKCMKNLFRNNLYYKSN
jgi:hypothetical protein